MQKQLAFCISRFSPESRIISATKRTVCAGQVFWLESESPPSRRNGDSGFLGEEVFNSSFLQLRG